MARPVIGKVPCTWSADAGWQVPPVYQFQLRQMQERLMDLPQDKPTELLVTVERAPKPRTQQQNRLMWALLQIMAREQNGGRAGGMDADDCYIQMLEAAGVEFDYLEVPAGALEILRGCYRVVKVVELLDGNRCTVKCGQGSSKYTTAEMHDFIESIFDRLADMGISDPEVTEYWRQWQGAELPGKE